MKLRPLVNLRVVLLSAALLMSARIIILGCQAQKVPASQVCTGSTVDSQRADLAQNSRAFLAELQTAVHDGDKAKVAPMVSFPVLVIHGSRKHV